MMSRYWEVVESYRRIMLTAGRDACSFESLKLAYGYDDPPCPHYSYNMHSAKCDRERNERTGSAIGHLLHHKYQVIPVLPSK